MIGFLMFTRKCKVCWSVWRMAKLPTDSIAALSFCQLLLHRVTHRFVCKAEWYSAEAFATVLRSRGSQWKDHNTRSSLAQNYFWDSHTTTAPSARLRRVTQHQLLTWTVQRESNRAGSSHGKNRPKDPSTALPPLGVNCLDWVGLPYSWADKQIYTIYSDKYT